MTSILPSRQPPCTGRQCSPAHLTLFPLPPPTIPLQLYPCRLSLVLLPLQEMLQVATLVDCVRRFVSIYGAPWHMRFKTLLLFMVVFSAKAVGGAALTAFTFYWLRKFRHAAREGSAAMRGAQWAAAGNGCQLSGLPPTF